MTKNQLIYFGLLVRATRCRVSKTKLDLLKDNGDNSDINYHQFLLQQ